MATPQPPVFDGVLAVVQASSLPLPLQVFGSQVFHDHWLMLRRLEEARLLREGGARAAALEDQAAEAYRNLYRTAWNLPHTRQVLAGCSHLMIWGDEDVVTNFGDMNGLINLGSGADAGSTPVSLRIMMRVAQSVYREYQRQLFDPTGIKFAGIDRVRPLVSVLAGCAVCDPVPLAALCCSSVTDAWNACGVVFFVVVVAHGCIEAATVPTCVLFLQPEKFAAIRERLHADRVKLLDVVKAKELEVEESRRAAQAAADQVNRWRVIQQKNARACCPQPAFVLPSCGA